MSIDRRQVVGLLLFALLCAGLGSYCGLWGDRGGDVHQVVKPASPSARAGGALAQGRDIAENSIHSESREAGAPLPTPTNSAEVLVKRRDGAPIAGALISLSCDGVALFHETTDAGGLATTSITGGATLRVDCSGFRPWSLKLNDQPQPRYEVVLLRPGVLEGTVVKPDGGAPDYSVWVVAWKAAEGISGTEAARIALASPETEHITKTGPDGSFRLDDLDDGAEYSLGVGGSGFLQSSPDPPAIPGVDRPRCEVCYGYGARLFVIDTSGTTNFSFDAFSPGAVNYVATSEDDQVSPYNVQSPSAVLNGVTAPDVGPSKTFLWASPSALGGSIRQEFKLQIPGFDDTITTFKATRILDGIAEIPIEVTATVRAWGTLRLIFRQAGASDAGHAVPVPPGILRMTDQHGGKHSYGVREGGQNEVVLRGLPYGRYKWRYSFKHAHYFIPPESEPQEVVDIGEHQATIIMNAPPAGSICLSIRGIDGSEYKGPALLTLGVGRPRTVPQNAVNTSWATHPGMKIVSFASTCPFERAPYQVSGLPAGTYYLRLETPFLSELATEDSVIEVEADRTTTVSLVKKE